MIVRCDNCNTRFRLKDEKIGPAGTRVRCSRCAHVFQVPGRETSFDAGASAAQNPRASTSAMDAEPRPETAVPWAQSAINVPTTFGDASGADAIPTAPQSAGLLNDFLPPFEPKSDAATVPRLSPNDPFTTRTDKMGNPFHFGKDGSGSPGLSGNANSDPAPIGAERFDGAYASTVPEAAGFNSRGLPSQTPFADPFGARTHESRAERSLSGGANIDGGLDADPFQGFSNVFDLGMLSDKSQAQKPDELVPTSNEESLGIRDESLARTSAVRSPFAKIAELPIPEDASHDVDLEDAIPTRWFSGNRVTLVGAIVAVLALAWLLFGRPGPALLESAAVPTIQAKDIVVASYATNHGEVIVVRGTAINTGAQEIGAPVAVVLAEHEGVVVARATGRVGISVSNEALRLGTYDALDASAASTLGAGNTREFTVVFPNVPEYFATARYHVEFILGKD